METLDLLTPAQAAEKLQVKEKTILDWLRARKLTGHKLGRFWRIKTSDLEAFVDARRVESQEPTPATGPEEGDVP